MTSSHSKAADTATLPDHVRDSVPYHHDNNANHAETGTNNEVRVAPGVHRHRQHRAERRKYRRGADVRVASPQLPAPGLRCTDTREVPSRMRCTYYRHHRESAPPYPFRHSSALGVPMWFPNDAYLDPAVAQPANSRRTLTYTPYAPARCDCNAVAFSRTRVCHARASNPAIGAMPDHQGTKVQRLSPHRLRRSSQRCTAEMSTVERELRRRIARCRHSDQMPGDVRRAVPAHDDHNDAHTSDGAAVHRRGGHGTDRCFHQRSHVVFRLGKHVLQRKLWRKRPAGVPNHVRNPVPDNGRT